MLAMLVGGEGGGSSPHLYIYTSGVHRGWRWVQVPLFHCFCIPQHVSLSLVTPEALGWPRWPCGSPRSTFAPKLPPLFGLSIHPLEQSVPVVHLWPAKVPLWSVLLPSGRPGRTISCTKCPSGQFIFCSAKVVVSKTSLFENVTKRERCPSFPPAHQTTSTLMS